MLWIKGNPGAGKSTVLKHALETAEQETKKGIILAWFFFHGRGAPMQKNLLGFFRSLLHQILQKSRELLSKFTSLYKYRCETEGKFAEKWDWDNRKLQSFFKQNVVDAARTHPMRIYIDALDECGEDLATELVEFFRFFAAPISICFSCRHYPFVALEGGNEVCVEQENKQDIESYINEKIDIHVQRVAIARVIRDEMVSRSNGNFQWVVVVLPRVLKLHKSRKSLLTIQTMIRNIPAELNELYTNLLRFFDEYERVQSLRLLQWISFAYRPLTLSQLRFALVASADTTYKSLRECRNSELYVDTDEDMERIVCDLSKGLAEVSARRSSRIVQFVHQSVRDFLLERGFQILDGSSAGTAVGRGHFWLSRSCVRYLLMEEFLDFATPPSKISRPFESTAVWQDRILLGEDCPMLDYSVEYLFRHVQKVDIANMSQNDLVASSYEPADGILLHSWFAVYQRLQHDRHFDGGTLLHAASKYHLIGVASAILARNPWADHKDHRSRTPLFIAAAKGHKVLVEMLINREDVDVNSKCDLGNTPLFIAAAMGHEAILEMLMDRNDVELSSRLARERQASKKELVSREDVDVYPVDNTGRMLLFIAAAKGRKDIVKMLMNRNGLDVNSKNRLGNTPFSEAARFGHVCVMQFLLERGVDLSPKNGQLTIALFEAASQGKCEVVELLLQQNANTNAQDSMNRTPLLYAASEGRYDVVKLLLQSNAHVNARDNKDRTPLSYAASWGHCKIAKLLLEYNANADCRDSEGRTPLSYAVSNSKYIMVYLLLQANANVNARDNKNRTPLIYAAPWGHYRIVKLLLQQNANPDSRDSEGRTPLSYAAAWGCHEIIELLLPYNVNVNARDNLERTPLSYAAINGCCVTVNLLLLRTVLQNVDIDVRDLDGRTPLSYAASYDHVAVVKLLKSGPQGGWSHDNCPPTCSKRAARRRDPRFGKGWVESSFLHTYLLSQ